MQRTQETHPQPLAAATDVGEERRNDHEGPTLRPIWRARLDPVPRAFLADIIWPLYTTGVVILVSPGIRESFRFYMLSVYVTYITCVPN